MGECPSTAIVRQLYPRDTTNNNLTSAYGLSSWIENSSRGVAAAYLAAADVLPFLPGTCERDLLVQIHLLTPIVAVTACLSSVAIYH